uniref:Uncharacterized protein n=1 Tax=Marmota marmota marmota TaxID=9994 RepID=A0A8C5ZIL3_MARMA
ISKVNTLAGWARSPRAAVPLGCPELLLFSVHSAGQSPGGADAPSPGGMRVSRRSRELSCVPTLGASSSPPADCSRVGDSSTPLAPEAVSRSPPVPGKGSAPRLRESVSACSCLEEFPGVECDCLAAVVASGKVSPSTCRGSNWGESLSWHCCTAAALLFEQGDGSASEGTAWTQLSDFSLSAS